MKWPNLLLDLQMCIFVFFVRIKIAFLSRLDS